MKIIRTEGNSKLVEAGGRRYVLPVDSDNLDLAISYGLPWEEMCRHPALPDLLRQAGIYTYEDLAKNHQAALGAIQAAYGQDLQQLLIAARNYSGGQIAAQGGKND